MKRTGFVLATVLVAALSGCSKGGDNSGQQPGPVDHAKLVEASQCMRENGYPDFPDPVEGEGTWVIPPPASELTPPPKCAELFRGAKGRPPERQLSAEEITKRRNWAECIRTNGIPNVPDPDSNGDFQLPPELDPITAQPNWAKAREACKSLEWAGADFGK